MTKDLLIHSMATFSPITTAVLDVINAKRVCEIGAEHGGNSKLLYQYLQARGGQLLSIDPAPNEAFLNWVPRTNGVVHHIPKLSLEGIHDVKTADAWFVDGDHNWYTVYHELMLLREYATKANKPLMIFMHDVGWPWARRDLYYNPDQIPAEFRHPLTWKEGVELDNPHVIPGGFRSHGAYALAIKEGGERNGVLTAIDDFVKQFKGQYCFANIPAVFGLGVIFDLAHPCADQIAAVLLPFHNNSLIQELEYNRLANYLKVIEWQDKEHGIFPSQKLPKASKIEEKRATPAFNMEATAIQLINMIDEKVNDAMIWDKLQQSIPQEVNLLNQFVDYLRMLASVPQEPVALKWIELLETIALMKANKIDAMQQKIQQLNDRYKDCQHIKNAINYVESLQGESA